MNEYLETQTKDKHEFALLKTCSKKKRIKFTKANEEDETGNLRYIIEEQTRNRIVKIVTQVEKAVIHLKNWQVPG